MVLTQIHVVYNIKWIGGWKMQVYKYFLCHFLIENWTLTLYGKTIYNIWIIIFTTTDAMYTLDGFLQQEWNKQCI